MAAVLKKAIIASYPDRQDVHVRRDLRKGRVSVFVGRTAVATMDPTNAEVTPEFFLWDHENLDILKFNKELLRDKAIELLESNSLAMDRFRV